MRGLLCVGLGLVCAMAGCAKQEAAPPPAPPEPVAAPEPVPEPAAAPVVGPTGQLEDYTGSLNCQGSEELELKNKRIKVAGDGPTTMAQCSIVISNCEIHATGFGVSHESNGTLKIKNSRVVGDKGSVVVRGPGNVIVKNTELKGRIRVAGKGNVEVKDSIASSEKKEVDAGRVVDQGGNTWN